MEVSPSVHASMNYWRVMKSMQEALALAKDTHGKALSDFSVMLFSYAIAGHFSKWRSFSHLRLDLFEKWAARSSD